MTVLGTDVPCMIQRLNVRHVKGCDNNWRRNRKFSIISLHQLTEHQTHNQTRLTLSTSVVCRGDALEFLLPSSIPAI